MDQLVLSGHVTVMSSCWLIDEMQQLVSAT